MIRAVVDTNVVIRAMIKPEGTVGPIPGRLRNGDYLLVYSQPLLDELLEKLALRRIREKYKIDEEAVEALLGLLALRGDLVTPSRRVKACRDPDDNAVLEAALAGHARYVVTGDQDLLVLKKFETIRVATPRAFLDVLG
jgi:uncharacterized protein